MRTSHKHKHQLHFQKAGEHMPSDKEMQLKILKSKLESFGIVTTDLDL